MRRRVPLMLSVLCLVLAVGVAREAYQLCVEDDPLADLGADTLRELGAGSGVETRRAAVQASTVEGPAAALPGPYGVIDSSAVFGSSKKPIPRPVLLGIAGRYAIVRAPDGRTDLVAEGAELGGVKVVRVATNRAVIEYEGKQEELTIFGGLGSTTLLPPGKEKNP